MALLSGAWTRSADELPEVSLEEVLGMTAQEGRALRKANGKAIKAAETRAALEALRVEKEDAEQRAREANERALDWAAQAARAAVSGEEERVKKEEQQARADEAEKHASAFEAEYAAARGREDQRERERDETETKLGAEKAELARVHRSHEEYVTESDADNERDHKRITELESQYQTALREAATAEEARKDAEEETERVRDRDNTDDEQDHARIDALEAEQLSGGRTINAYSLKVAELEQKLLHAENATLSARAQFEQEAQAHGVTLNEAYEKAASDYRDECEAARVTCNELAQKIKELEAKSAELERERVTWEQRAQKLEELLGAEEQRSKESSAHWQNQSTHQAKRAALAEAKVRALEVDRRTLNTLLEDCSVYEKYERLVAEEREGKPEARGIERLQRVAFLRQRLHDLAQRVQLERYERRATERALEASDGALAETKSDMDRLLRELRDRALDALEYVEAINS